MTKNRSVWESLNNALGGVILSLRYEKNIRFHFLIGFFVFIYTLFLNLTMTERALIVFAIFFVIAAEMFNTAIEHIIDFFITTNPNPVIKMVKDISSGAVFLAAVNSILVGFFILYRNSYSHVGWLIKRMRSMENMTIFFSIVIVVTLVVFIKAVTKTGTPFHGGFPSGHAAFGFAVFALSVLYVDYYVISVLIFIMAFILSKARVDRGIHTPMQVISGGILGFLVTILINNILTGG